MSHLNEPGVSPAYFISYHGLDFSVADATSHLKELAALGYRGVQAEVPQTRYIADWINRGARAFGRRAVDLNLEVRQFVAHFVLEHQQSSLWMVDDTLTPVTELAHAASALEGCRVVTIPLGTDPAGDHGGYDGTTVAHRLHQLQDYAHRLVETFPPWMNLAFEPTPGSLLSTVEHAAQFFEGVETARIGVNLDTGNLWSQGTDPALFARAIGSRRLFGTHLCDNFGSTSQSLRPGAGTIDWSALFQTLNDIAYAGPFDIEIRATGADVGTQYRDALAFVSELINLHIDTTQGGR